MNPQPDDLPSPKSDAGELHKDQLLRSSRQAYIQLVLGGICLGISPIVVKALPLSADVSAFYRVALSAPLFIIFAFFFASNTESTVQQEH